MGEQKGQVLKVGEAVAAAAGAFPAWAATPPARLASLEPEILLDGMASRLRRDTAPVAAPAAPVPQTPVDLALAIELAREQVGVLEAAIASARDGVFLADGYNDSPYAGQRLYELQTRYDALEAEHRGQLRAVRDLAARVTQERLSVNRRAEAPLVARGRRRRARGALAGPQK